MDSMSGQITLHNNSSNDSIRTLENEISELENELQEAEVRINAFEFKIRSQLHAQIRRVQELTALYKKQKQGKKAKRLEQKKKGKRYKEPRGIKKVNEIKSEAVLSVNEQQELKRLYKEAIVHVHPDKFINENEEKNQRATDLTVQLNSLYKSGNLEELNQFHEHIISGNAMSHVAFEPASIKDTVALLAFLQKKKNELADSLKETKASYTYVVLDTYNEPMDFIGELKIQFEQRIIQLERRTRS